MSRPLYVQATTGKGHGERLIASNIPHCPRSKSRAFEFRNDTEQIQHRSFPPMASKVQITLRQRDHSVARRG